MTKAAVIYGSTTGNCETLAEYIYQELKTRGIDTTLKNVTDVNVSALADYDCLLLGSSTWGDGELQDDFIDFEAAMEGIDLSGKKAAVFGCGETSWPEFCAAVDIIEARLKGCGAAIVGEGLKVDGDIEESQATDWVATLTF